MLGQIRVRWWQIQEISKGGPKLAKSRDQWQYTSSVFIVVSFTLERGWIWFWPPLHRSSFGLVASLPPAAAACWGVSLNEQLLSGPDLLQRLPETYFETPLYLWQWLPKVSAVFGGVFGDGSRFLPDLVPGSSLGRLTQKWHLFWFSRSLYRWNSKS